MSYEQSKMYTATAEFRRNFWKALRGRNFKDDVLANARIAGLGSYNVPPGMNHRLMGVLDAKSLFRKIATNLTSYDTGSRIMAKDCEDLAMFVPEKGELPVYDAIEDFTVTPVDRHKMATLVKIDEDFLHDATFDFDEYILERIGRSFARTETQAFINGTGVEMPTGILCPDKGAEVALTTSELNYDNVLALYFSLEEEYRERAVWLMNDTTALYLRTLKDDNGNYLWRDSDNTILGKRVVTSEFMPDIAPGAMPVVFGDFKYYWVVTRSPLSLRILTEKFMAVGQVAYMCFLFLDGKLIRRKAMKTIQIAEAE